MFPSKPGQEHASQNVIAAAESASRLKRQLENGLAQILYGPEDLSARRITALDALMNAEARSDKNRLPKEDDSNTAGNIKKVPPTDPSAF